MARRRLHIAVLSGTLLLTTRAAVGDSTAETPDEIDTSAPIAARRTWRSRMISGASTPMAISGKIATAIAAASTPTIRNWRRSALSVAVGRESTRAIERYRPP